MPDYMSDSELEARLGQLLGRFDPFTVAARACYLPNKSRASQSFVKMAVPHFLARMVSVAHAHHRDYYCTFFDDKSYRKAHNLLAEHTDEVQRHALLEEQDLHHWGQIAYRQQIELQYRADGIELARLAAINSADHARGGDVSQLLERHTGLSLPFVTAYSILLHSNLIAETGTGFRRDRGTTKHGGQITDEQIEHYLSIFGWEPKALGAAYRASRDAIARPYLKSLALSPLLHRPVVASRDGELLTAPFPDLIIRSALDAPFRVVRMRAGADHQLVDALFAGYVKNIAQILGERWPVLVRDLDSEALPSGKKRCDLVLELPNYDLYVECKTTGNMPRFPFAEPLRSSGLATALIEATEQLAATPGLLARDDRPRRSLIILWNDLPFANSQWFRENTIDRAEQASDWYELCGARPEVMSIREFELFVAKACAGDREPLAILDAKDHLDYSAVGDWGTWLNNEGAAQDARRLDYFSSHVKQGVQLASGLVAKRSSRP